MRYSIDVRDGYLRAEMIERETAQETRRFSQAVHAMMLEKGVARLLVTVRSSLPIFRVDEYQLSDFFKLVSAIRGLRVALVSDTKELAAAHEYVELIAGQHGIALRAFHAEAPALEWLLGG